MSVYDGPPLPPKWFPFEADLEAIEKNGKLWAALSREQQAKIMQYIREGKEVPKSVYE